MDKVEADEDHGERNQVMVKVEECSGDLEAHSVREVAGNPTETEVGGMVVVQCHTYLCACV